MRWNLKEAARSLVVRRRARGLILAGALSVVWSCADHPLDEPTGKPSRVLTQPFQETVNKDLDLIFMVDDSPSMDKLQDKLADQFQAFMQVLQELPSGLPNVHIAVVTSNLGTGIYELDKTRCPFGGAHGQFQFNAGINGKVKGANGLLAPCTSTGLMPGQTFISDLAGANGSRVTNYTGDISDVFSCIAGRGSMGCGFESPLASVARALGADGQEPPDSNLGFLRPNAFLAIVYITNEDDGSVPANSRLFAPDDPTLSPLDNFRPQEYGILCDGAPPPLDAAMSWPPGHCLPNSDGRLIPVPTLVDQIRSLKADPSQILVAAIAGPTDPYGTHLEPISSQTSVQSAFVNHSCTTPDQSYADPGVRISGFVDAFAGIYRSICEASFAPALTQIAMAIGKKLGPKCVQGPFVDKDLTKLGIQPDCSVVDRQLQAGGAVLDTALPSCDDPHDGKCWTLTADPANCPGADQLVLGFVPPPDPSLSNLTVSVSCSVCIRGKPQPGCP
jgi:hypothetical protein